MFYSRILTAWTLISVVFGAAANYALGQFLVLHWEVVEVTILGLGSAFLGLALEAYMLVHTSQPRLPQRGRPR